MYRGPGMGASDVQNVSDCRQIRQVKRPFGWSADLDWLFKLMKGAEPPREDSVSRVVSLPLKIGEAEEVCTMM